MRVSIMPLVGLAFAILASNSLVWGLAVPTPPSPPTTDCAECTPTSESFFVDPLDLGGAGNVQFNFESNKTTIGLHFAPSPQVVHDWTTISIDASGVDHKPGYGEQTGPGASSRAVAITQIAIYDAVLTIFGGYEPFCLPASAAGSHPNAHSKAAIATAAHATLVQLFKKQIATFDAAYNAAMASIPDSAAKVEGIAVGEAAAACILALRSNDNSTSTNAVLGTGPGQYNPPAGPILWRQDPISLNPKAVGLYWQYVTPFVMDSASQFRLPPPPAPNSAQFAEMYNEVKSIGALNSTTRTADQTEAGLYWAYDGLPSLCAPPRLYLQISMHLLKTVPQEQQICLSIVETARALAAISTSMADAAIASWESKYYYNMARPITAIRYNDDPIWGDQNAATEPDPTWIPLGAPADNTNGPDFTPPFPAYPSGHATFGGAVFQSLRKIFGTDNIAFSFMSDEFNGVTKDNNGNTRPVKSRSFTNLSHAELENGQSRLYLGIHWQCDCDNGINMGRHVSDLVFQRKFDKASP